MPIILQLAPNRIRSIVSRFFFCFCCNSYTIQTGVKKSSGKEEIAVSENQELPTSRNTEHQQEVCLSNQPTDPAHPHRIYWFILETSIVVVVVAAAAVVVKLRTKVANPSRQCKIALRQQNLLSERWQNEICVGISSSTKINSSL